MSRSQQDTVIDDDEETCPLCIEEFDLGDKNFRPCPCGYQICQFCFNSLKNTYEKSTCPNCRRPYDEKTIQYKIPTAEDIKQDLLNKNKKQIAAKRRENEKKEVEASSRRNLAGVRVKQQNLVYVIGLVPTLKDEHQLLQTLRGDQYFGQYGDIEKIVVSKPKPGGPNQGIGVYVTFARKEDAAVCISMVDGSQNGDRVLRAQYGTTKYCSAYLRGEVCNNKNCTFLHESGEEGQHSSLQNESLRRPTTSAQGSHVGAHRPGPPGSVSSVGTSQPMRAFGSERKGSHDASALPTTASWAKAEAIGAVRARRESQTASRSSPSPQVAHATLLQADTKRKDAATPPAPQASRSAVQASRAPPSQTSSGKSSPKPSKTKRTIFDDLITSVNSPDFRFVFDDTTFSKEDLAAIYRIPTLIDPFGGAKRRIMREKEVKEQAKAEAEAQDKMPSTVASTLDALEDEQMLGGSLQLGGEPDDPALAIRRGEAQNVIGRPLNQMQANNTINDQFSNLNIDGRSLTPHQRQQLALLSSANVPQAPGLTQQNQTGFSGGGFDASDQRSGLFANQTMPYETASGHARQASRFSFGNDTAKTRANGRYGQQTASTQQQHYYPSGVQGPPPGLKTAGTPPISGGGMFAQGHGFTSNMNTAFGTNKDTNQDMFLRGRSGTAAGHETKRESFSSSNLLRSPRSLTPGLLNSLYGSMSGAYQDPGLVKQKKKGKKQRHANTSSAGGVVDLADPSILQARLHQSGAGMGQGVFGGQSQDEQDFPPLNPPPGLTPSSQISRFFPSQTSLEPARRAGTPKVPPGLSLPHGHPPPGLSTPERSESPAQFPGIIAPALPLMPTEQRTPTPSRNASQPKTIQTSSKGLPVESKSEVVLEDKPQNPSIRHTVSTGSPNPKAIKSVRSITPKDEALHEVAEEKEPGKKKDSVDSAKATNRAAKPQKIDLSTLQNANVATAISDAAKEIITEQTHLVATPGSISRPSTPGFTASKTPEPTSIPRPRTLRLTTTSTTPKPVEATPSSANGEKASSLPAVEALRIHSRRPSVASLTRSSRPASPAISEIATSSINMSRAGSPPPSIVGSAPEKFKSKNQLKKERKAKVKETTEDVGSSGAQKATSSSATPAEEVGPILSRQKKKKRPQESVPAPKTKVENITSSTLDERPSEVDVADSGTGKNSPVKKEKPSAKAETKQSKQPSVVSTPAPSKPSSPSPEPEARPFIPTLRDFYQDLKIHAASTNAQDIASLIPDLLDQYISDAPAMLASMFQSGEIDPTSALFNPPSLTSYRLPHINAGSPTPNRGKNSSTPPPQSNVKPSAAYELTFGPQGSFSGQYAPAYPFGTITLTNTDRKALLNGHPIRLNDAARPNDLHHRIMITPKGTVYRHMSAEEEEKVLELESRMDDASLLGLYGPDDIDDDVTDEYGNEYGDFENLRGGVEELVQRPARHGIVWVSSGSSSERKGRTRRKADHQPVKLSISQHNGKQNNCPGTNTVGGDATTNINKPNATVGHDGYDQDDEQGPAGYSDENSHEGSEESLASEDEDLLSILPTTSQGDPNMPPLYPLAPHLHAKRYAASSGFSSGGGSTGKDSTAANARTMDVASLINRINSSKTEMEASKKEVEVLEKKVVRRGKDVSRWRDAILSTVSNAPGSGEK